jgi:hypothetical protein
MTSSSVTAERWESLCSASNDFTCYSAAVATWLAATDEDWPRLVNAGLWLTITEASDGLFGFAYFRPERRAELGLVRTGADELGAAVDGVLEELDRSGRVIVAGDGFHLPWHVAAGRHHLPHWFVLARDADGLAVLDPFACRNELGEQTATRHAVSPHELGDLLPALPGDSAIHRLREVLALGDETTEAADYRHQWFVDGEVPDWRKPAGRDGPAAVRRLAEHFRERGQDPRAYAQADDIWSIARHRAFLCRYAQAQADGQPDDRLAGWVGEHARPLAKRWGHIAPLIMQATLSLQAGRPASSSVPDTLERLADMEASAGDGLEQNSFTI